MFSLVVRIYGLELCMNRAILFSVYSNVTLEVVDEAIVLLEVTGLYWIVNLLEHQGDNVFATKAEGCCD